MFLLRPQSVGHKMKSLSSHCFVCQSQLHANDVTYGRGIKGTMIDLESNGRIALVDMAKKKEQSKWFCEMPRLLSDVRCHTTTRA